MSVLEQVPRLSVWQRISDGAYREVTALAFILEGGKSRHEVYTDDPTPAGVEDWRWRHRDRNHETLSAAAFLRTHRRLDPDEQERARREVIVQLTLGDFAWERREQLWRRRKVDDERAREREQALSALSRL